MALGTIKVKVGDKVNSGQEIGTMGTTGSSTGNHLHFEIAKIDGDISPSEYYSSTRLDPCDFFNDDCSPIGGGVGNGEFLFTSGYTPDSSYQGQTYPLSSEERSEMLWIIYNEFGTGGYEGMVLQAQCLRDALVMKYNNCTPMNIKDSMRYEYSAYRNSRSVTDNSEDAKRALEYVFDQGGSAIQHRILFMCPNWFYGSANDSFFEPANTGNYAYGKTIDKIFQYGDSSSGVVYFFDVL